MNKLLAQSDTSGTAHGCASPAMAREAQRNRLCELRQAPCFDEWWRLTLALGLEDCLLLLANEIAAGDAALLATALTSLAQAPGIAAEDGDDRWVNPLFPLPQPEVRMTVPLRLPAGLDNSPANVAASAE